MQVTSLLPNPLKISIDPISLGTPSQKSRTVDVPVSFPLAFMPSIMIWQQFLLSAVTRPPCHTAALSGPSAHWVLSRSFLHTAAGKWQTHTNTYKQLQRQLGFFFFSTFLLLRWVSHPLVKKNRRVVLASFLLLIFGLGESFTHSV